MSFRNFFEENVVVPFTGGYRSLGTIDHLRNMFGASDPSRGGHNDPFFKFKLEPHWADKDYGRESHNFSAYASKNPLSHERMVDLLHRKIKEHGGRVLDSIPAKMEPDKRNTTTVIFKDSNGYDSHAVVHTNDNTQYGVYYRHGVHVVQNRDPRDPREVKESLNEGYSTTNSMTGSTVRAPYHIFKLRPGEDGKPDIYQYQASMASLTAGVAELEKIHADNQTKGGVKEHWAITLRAGGSKKSDPPYEHAQVQVMLHPKGGVIFAQSRGAKIRYPDGVFENAIAV